MSGYAGLFVSGSAVLAPAMTLIVRKWPTARRPLTAVFGLSVIGGGVGVPHLIFPFASAVWIGWMVASMGAMLLFAAGPAWPYIQPLKDGESGVPLKPATGRPLRHFGETT